MLRANAPSDTWTSVGNGTYRGIYHELHFIHNDNVIGHKVVQGGSSNNPRLAKRYSRWNDGWDDVDGPIQGEWWRKSPIKDTLTVDRINNYGAVATSEWVGNSVADATAYSNNTRYCLRLSDGTTVSSETLAGAISLSQGGSINDPSSGEAALASCDQFNGTVGSVIMTCEAVNSTFADPGLLDDPDGNQTSWKWPVITTRDETGGPDTGQPVPYAIHDYFDDEAEIATFWSATYPNGGRGEALRRAGGDYSAFAVVNRRDCTSTAITDNALIGQRGRAYTPVDGDHVMERQTFMFYMSFIQYPWFDLADGGGYQTVPRDLGNVPFSVIRDYMAVPYNEWLPLEPQATNSLFDDLAISLGSTVFPEVMTNLEHALNLMKARVWNSFGDPSADSTWTVWLRPTTDHTRDALNAIRYVSRSIPLPKSALP
jgi:hypothetical protein